MNVFLCYTALYDTREKIAKDYTKEQLDVWATGIVDLKEWDESFSKYHTVVAVENHEIVGFGDIDDFGYFGQIICPSRPPRERNCICNL